MDLTTSYLGMELRTPLVASASPLSEDVDSIRALEDGGIAAVVLHSLFEEQIVKEQVELHERTAVSEMSYAEALTYFPVPSSNWRKGPDEYLEHVQAAKAAVDVPIIASLNGASLGGWIEFAGLLEEAGADALELNIYAIPTESELASSEIEGRYINIVRSVRDTVRIPVAVKIGPFFTNLAYMAREFEAAGANGLVLFNRFYQPDIDLESLEVVPNLLLSTPQALRLPLRWIAILRGQFGGSLAATSGVHWAHDVLKMLLVGADVTMLCSTLIRHGSEVIATIESGMSDWLERHEYESVRQMQGSMSQKSCPDPGAYERTQYIKTLQTFRIPGR
jgi:dihydroorotate dehydrogenase (fumarate)